MSVHDGNIIPTDLAAEAAAIEQRVERLRRAVGDVVTAYEAEGATEEQLADLDEISRHLETVVRVGDLVLTAIEEADITETYEEDASLSEDEVYGIIRHFAEREGGGFTAADLKAHLRNLGVVLPQDSKAFTRMFANWREDIAAEKIEAGENVRWLKLPKAKHVLAVVRVVGGTAAGGTIQALPTVPKETRLEPEAPATPAPAKESRRPSAEEPATEPDHRLGERALALAAEMAGEKANLIVRRLAEQAGISPHAARDVFDELIARERLFRDRKEGSLHYSLEPVDRRSKPGQPQEKNRGLERLTPEQKKTARLMLHAMSGRYTYVTRPLTPQEIVRQMDEVQEGHGSNAEEVSEISKQLQRQGMVVRVQAKEGRKRARAKRLMVLKIGIKNQAVMTMLRTPEGAADIARLIETGETLETEG